MLIKIDDRLLKIARDAESTVTPAFFALDEIEIYNQSKVLRVFQENRISAAHFTPTNGYGYDDIGRDVLDRVFAEIFNAEDAIVRHNIVSGTHALTLALFALLTPGKTLLSVTGKPYDTLECVIGLRGSGQGSLQEYGMGYKQIELAGQNFDFSSIELALLDSDDIGAVFIQRSRGYSERSSLSVKAIGEAISFIKSKRDIPILVDNCYGEFTGKLEPTDVRADLIAGSLIKNPGGGIAQTGGYVAGKRRFVERAAYRLTAPGSGRHVGASLGHNREMFMGLYMAPHTVVQAIKTAVFAAALYSELGFKVSPQAGDSRNDIIQAVSFGNRDKLIAFCQGIQSGAPVDSHVTPVPWEMPGYDCDVIMAAGAFTQGSSIELSADAPLREPYTAFLQGGLTYPSGKIGVLLSAQSLLEKGLLSL